MGAELGTALLAEGNRSCRTLLRDDGTDDSERSTELKERPVREGREKPGEEVEEEEDKEGRTPLLIDKELTDRELIDSEEGEKADELLGELLDELPLEEDDELEDEDDDEDEEEEDEDEEMAFHGPQLPSVMVPQYVTEPSSQYCAPE